MIDMGVEPFLVASTVEAVMAQRLVRKLCKPMQKAIPADAGRDARRLSLGSLRQGRATAALHGRRLRRACRNLGYSGRMGIYELLVTTDKIRQISRKNALARTRSKKQASKTEC